MKSLKYHIDELFLKAGKKNIAKLVKKKIVDKRGRITTTYVLPAEAKKDHKKVLSFIMSLFGYKKERQIEEHISYDYKAWKLEDTMTEKEFGNHFIEYFKNKDKYDAMFSKTKPGGGGKKKKGKGKGTGGGGGGGGKSKWNMKVMRMLFDQYGGAKPKKPVIETSTEDDDKIRFDVIKKEGFDKKGKERADKGTERGKTKERLKYVDVGEKIGGARKDLSELRKKYDDDFGASVNLADLPILEEDVGMASKYVTRNRQLGVENMAEYVKKMKDLNMSPGAAFLISKLFGSISPKPGDSPAERKLFIMGMERVVNMFARVTNVEEFKSVYEAMTDEAGGFGFTPEEKENYDKYKTREKEIDSQQSNIWRSQYMSRFSRDAGSKRYWNDPQVNKLQEEKNSIIKLMRDMENIAEKRTADDPLSLWNQYKSLGKSFTAFALINSQSYSISRHYGTDSKKEKSARKRMQNLLYEARQYESDSNWEWFEEGGKGGGGKRGSKWRPLWDRNVPEQVERSGGRSVEDFLVEKMKTGKSKFSSQAMLKAFNLRGIEYGNWMDVDSSAHHTKMCAAALFDLADILGISDKMASLNGRLSIGFGSRGSGHASAHYEPAKKVINLTKFKGGGSLAHEWGHSFDNIISMLMHEGGGGQMSFQSDEYSPKAELTDDVKGAFQNVMNALMKGDYRPKLRMTVKDDPSHTFSYYGTWDYDKDFLAWAKENNRDVKEGGENERGKQVYVDWSKVDFRDVKHYLEYVANKKVEYYRNRYSDSYYQHYTDKDWKGVEKSTYSKIRKDYDVKYILSAYANAMKAKQKEGEKYEMPPMTLMLNPVRPETKEGGKFTGMSHFAATADRMPEYWKRPREMFARAFETFISDELEDKKMKNTYLVSGITEKEMDKFGKEWEKITDDDGNSYFGDGLLVSVYPRGKERERIRDAMKTLVAKMKEADMFNKALKILEEMDVFGIKI